MSFLVSVVKPLAYLSLPVVLLRSIAASSPLGRYYVRQGVYIGTLMTVAACSAVVAAGMAVVGKQYDVNHIVARTFYFLANYATGIAVEVEGEEYLDAQPAVLMANHQTMLDILVVGRLMPKHTSMMAKKSLQFTPLGPFMTMSGGIFIDRGNNVRAVQSLKAAGELMRRLKISLWIFPEGTRTSSEIPDMLPLKKGGFHLAVEGGIPIIPIVTENYWRLYHKGVFDEGTIKVRVLPPISTTGLTASDIPALTTRVRDQMLATLREISVVPSNSWEIEKPLEKPREIVPDSASAPPAPDSFSGSDNKNISHISDPASASSASISSSYSSPALAKSETSENSADTEEDEGMILVGRPT